jgi:hypothetical protein
MNKNPTVDRILVLLILVISTTLVVSAQEKKLLGVGFFNWGISKEEVKQEMRSKFDLQPGYNEDNALGFQGGTYLNEKLHIWVFYFSEDKLNEIDLVIKNENSPVAQIFYEVMHNLTQEFSDPDLYKPDYWKAEWFYYDMPGNKINATINVAPYSTEKDTTIKLTFTKVE